jgi:hypothetical protein
VTDQPEVTEAELKERKNLDLQTAVGNLEDARMLAHDALKFVRRSGVPQELHDELVDLYRRTESLEARLGGYAVEVAA